LVLGAGYAGFHMPESASGRNVFSHNEVRDSTTGFNVMAGAGTLLVANSVIHASGDGMQLLFGSDIVATKNRVVAPGGVGIIGGLNSGGTSVFNLTLTENTVLSPAGDGIQVFAAG